MMKTQQLFSASWVQTAPLVISDPICPKLRGSQPRAFKALKDHDHVILNAPTGWGKSLVIVFLVLYKLLKHKKLRCIIAVPQTLIASGFISGKGKVDWKIKMGRKLIPWVVNVNLCHSEASDTIMQLIKFLSSRYKTLGDRVLICTHATLARTYQKLAKQGHLELFDDTMLWIDEAHHVMNAQVLGGGTISNSIGALVRHCVANDSPVGLATATFMRGDMHHIIPEPLLQKFVRFNIPYDVYFKEMQPVASFEFNVICGDLMEALDSIFKKIRPTILYLAKRNSRYASRCKYSEVQKILSRLSKRIKKPICRTDILIYVGDLRVLDLVTEKGRRRRKAYLDNGGEVDLIIALDTCKEGFDWPEAERSILIGERHSVPEMIQMIGRLFRRAEGKTHAEVFQVMPTIVENSKVYKDHCNSVLSVVFAAMLLEDIQRRSVNRRND
jgi:superfamily II DNA or RNA helicase